MGLVVTVVKFANVWGPFTKDRRTDGRTDNIGRPKDECTIQE